MIGQLRVLKLFPMTLSREGSGLAAKVKVLLRAQHGRVDVTFHLTDNIIANCPTNLASVPYSLDLRYGTDIK
jgi:hypothetical protein